jgi:hypothetical protein
MPYVFLAIAIVSVAASAVLWKRQHDHHPKPGTRVIATTAAPSKTLAITAFHAPAIWHCSPGSPESDNTVVISWSTTGAQSVDISVDNAAKPFATSQSPESQTSVPAPCAPKRHTYRLVARSADGHTATRSATIQGV